MLAENAQPHDQSLLSFNCLVNKLVHAGRSDCIVAARAIDFNLHIIAEPLPRKAQYTDLRQTTCLCR